MSPLARSPLMLEHALLGFLRQQPTHAYEIHQMLQQSEELGLVWRLKQSQLYALLTRLEEAGYIASTTEPQGSRPPRKILRLTSEGHAAFEEWVVSPVEHGRDFRLEFLAKLFFARQQGNATAAQLIAEQRRACQEWLDQLRAKAAHSNERSYDWLVVQFRVGQLEAILDWLIICEATLTHDE